ncbi:hypothetical protein ACFQDN_22185 [Pseudomonas asuensis]
MTYKQRYRCWWCPAQYEFVATGRWTSGRAAVKGRSEAPLDGIGAARGTPFGLCYGSSSRAPGTGPQKTCGKPCHSKALQGRAERCKSGLPDWKK